MSFTLEIMPNALAELKSIKVFYRRQIRDAIDAQLASQPLAPTKNRKLMGDPETSFACDPPIWELRVGEYRVFYDVDETTQTVFVRAIREKPPHATTEEVL
jgi:mRNA-degrading endonuclease RelE of RelBE toxin-antitoxin system